MVPLTAQVSAPVDLASAVVERGPHHQVIEIIRRSEDTSIVTNRFTQLGTQLNRLDPKTGDYVPAVARWDQTPEGYFVSVETAHQVILAPRLLTDSAVDVLSSDGARIQCTPLCLLYVSGDESVLLGTIQDRPAERLSDTEVIYRDVFGADDPVRADYRVRIELDRVEGDLILRTGLPDPKALGWSPETVRVVMVTEAFEGTAPTIVDRESDVPGLRFGNLELAPGKAFALGADPATEDVPVTSTWSEKDGRKLLYEATQFTPLVPLLGSLPPADQARALAGDWRLLAGQVPSPARRRHTTPNPTMLASLNRSERARDPATRTGLDPAPGVVLDWTLLASQSALTLAGNVTHLVQNAVNVTSLTIEPCSVVKYTNNGAGRIYVSGSVNCRTGPYRPAFFTHVFDATLGEAIATGDPTATWAGHAMLEFGPMSVTLNDLRFRHAQVALRFNNQGSTYTHTLRNLQMVRCRYGVAACGSGSDNRIGFFAGNVLMVNVGTAFTGYSYNGTVQHLTADGVTLLANASTYYGPGGLWVRNSILANVTTFQGQAVTLSGSGYNGFYSGSPTPPTFGSPTFPVSANPFTTVGAGSHYLAPISPFWNKGTADIENTLAGHLKTRTVEPPLERTTGFTQDTVLAGWAQRDSDGLPDLGYHFEALDFCWSGLALNNATLTLTNGVGVGLYGAAGLNLGQGAKLISEGAPLGMNRIVRPALVQENYAHAWLALSPSMTLLKVSGAYGTRPEIRCRFTEWAVPAAAWDQMHWLDCRQTPSTSPTYPLNAIALTDCQLWNVRVSLYPGWSGMTVGVTNTLFHATYFYADQKRYYGTATFSLNVYNALFHGGAANLHYSDASVAWTVKDNFFDRAAVGAQGSQPFVNANNGYYLSSVLPGATGTRTVTQEPSYQGTEGQFYYPGSGTAGSVTAELVNRGSRSAGAAGLWHHTTLANESKDGVNDATQVDVGFHYVARVNGQPADSDTGGGDGLPDWLEDRNGNGSAADDLYSFTNRDTDGDGATDYAEYLAQWEVAQRNVLVNDPAQDYGNERNTQWQPKVVVLGDTVVVGYWDSNIGVYGLGDYAGSSPSRMVAWSVSRDGGRTFIDQGAPPLLSPGLYGDAGDPVLAVNRVTGTIYFVGTSERNNDGDNGVPMWTSTDGGVSFTPCDTVLPWLDWSDYPWIAVDDWRVGGPPSDPTYFHDVYVSMWSIGGSNMKHTVALGGGDTWTDRLEFGYGDPHMQQMAVGTDHVLYAAWRQDFPDGNPPMKSLEICSFTGRGETRAAPHKIVDLLAPYEPGEHWIRLLRNQTSPADDCFKAFIVPALAVNPTSGGLREDDLYVAYTDKGSAQDDRADVFLVYSTDGVDGDWAPTKQRVNTVAANDQWMPVIAVKPDGNQLFIAWCDRRDDPANSLIHVYGRFGSIDGDGQVTFPTPDFCITTTSFPPAFPGVLAANKANGHYDPVWAPGGVPLDWFFGSNETIPPGWWPVDFGDPLYTDPTYAREHGEHNGAFADEAHVYLVWSDHRSDSLGTLYPERNQSDIRLARIPWPIP